eukprot:UN03057
MNDIHALEMIVIAVIGIIIFFLEIKIHGKYINVFMDFNHQNRTNKQYHNSTNASTQCSTCLTNYSMPSHCLKHVREQPPRVSIVHIQTPAVVAQSGSIRAQQLATKEPSTASNEVKIITIFATKIERILELICYSYYGISKATLIAYYGQCEAFHGKWEHQAEYVYSRIVIIVYGDTNMDINGFFLCCLILNEKCVYKKIVNKNCKTEIIQYLTQFI